MGLRALGGALLLLCLAQQAHALVIGVDLGSRFFKVGLLQAGRPYDLILNTESKRKTSTAVALLGKEERLFGDTAQGTATRRPKDTFLLATTLLGCTENDQALHWVKESLLPYKWVVDEERGTYRVAVDDEGTQYSVEELVAMILEHAKQLASAAAETDIKDAVIAVPAFFTQQQRSGVVAAANIAGITVTGLINDNTAVALLYGVEKEKEFKQEESARNVLFFDMGATSTRASVVRFGSTRSKLEKKSNKTVGEYWVKSVEWDSTLGTLAFDNIIMDMIATAFNAKVKVVDGADDDVRNFPTAVARMRKSAEKTKEVLSTIPQTTINIEGLWNDKDFSMPITREEFETRGASLLERVLPPVKAAMAAAELEPSDLYSVEVVGGGSRIPGVQEVLKAWLGKDLSMSLNGDDAVALGATLYAAKISPAHRMREFVLRDANPYPINVRVQPIGHSGDDVAVVTGDGEVQEDSDVISREVFAKGGKMPVSKRLTFARATDFEVRVDYSPSVVLPAGTSHELSHFTVAGIEAALEKYGNDIVADDEEEEEAAQEEGQEGEEKRSGGDKKARTSLSLQLTQAAMVELARYDATITVLAPLPEEKKDEEAAAAAEGEGEEQGKEGKADDAEAAEQGHDGEEQDKASGDGETDGEQKEAEAEEAQDKGEEEEGEGEGEKKKDEGEEAKEEAKEAKPRSTKKHIKLTIEYQRVEGSRSAMSDQHIADSVRLLGELKKADEARQRLEAAKNELETHIYAVREFLYDAERLDDVCAEEEKEKILEQLTAAEDWLYDEGFDQTTDVYQAKLVEVQDVSAGVRFRHDELTKRPIAVAAARKIVSVVHDKVEEWNTTKPWINGTDKEGVLNKTAKFERWLDESEAEQAARSLREDPVFTSADVERKLAPVESAFKRVSRIPKPKPPKVPTNSTRAANRTRTAKAKRPAQGEGEGEGNADAPAGGEGEEGEQGQGEGEGDQEAGVEGEDVVVEDGEEAKGSEHEEEGAGQDGERVKSEL